MRQLPNREEFLFILFFSSQIECLISIFNKTNILKSLVKIENKQPSHLLYLFYIRRAIYMAISPGKTLWLNSFYDISDPVLDWSGMTIVLIGIVTKKNTTSVHYQRLAIQCEADVYRSFHFGS